MNVAIVEGKVMPLDAAQIGVEDRGFAYGDAAFESMAVFHGRAPLLDGHLDRLRKGCKVLSLSPESGITKRLWLADLARLCEASGSQHGIWRCRVARLKGQGYNPDGRDAAVLHTFHPNQHSKYQEQPGISLSIYRKVPKAQTPWSAFKCSESLLYVMAALDAQSRGADDALILNAEGHLIEATSSNLFVRHGDLWSSPGLKSGCVAGVMRALVLDILGNKARTAEFNPGSLARADEVMLTNAVRGVQPVLKIGDRSFRIGHANDILHRINTALS